MEAKLIGAAALAAAIGICAPASATMIQAEFSGTTTAAFSTASLYYGADNASLVGLPFKLDFIFDTANPGFNLGETLNTGERFPRDSSEMSATFTLNGVTKTITGLDDWTIFAANGDPHGFNQVAFRVIQDDNNLASIRIIAIAGDNAGDIPASLDVPLTFIPDPSDSASGSFQFAALGDSLGSGISLAPNMLVYSIVNPKDGADGVGGVPEPRTWMMLLAGFAGVALLGYCRVRDRPSSRPSRALS